jgi:hypothetical protein
LRLAMNRIIPLARFCLIHNLDFLVAGDEGVMAMPGPLAGVLTNFLASWRPNEKRLLFSNRRGNLYSETKSYRKGSSLFWTRFPFLAVGCTHSGMDTEV